MRKAPEPRRKARESTQRPLDAGRDDPKTGEGAPSKVAPERKVARRITLHGNAAGEGTRVDRFVAEHTQLSRSAITRMAREGRVLSGGVAVQPAHKVRRGEELIIEVPPEEPLSLEAEDIPVEILYEDRDVIVVNKPPDLVVHPAYGHKSGTLVNALIARIAARQGREAARPGIVHRLDKDTSGVLVIAKNDVAQLALARQLQAQRVGKEYIALVWGDPGSDPALVEAPLLRDPNDRRRMVVRAGGRDSATRFARIAVYGDGAKRRALLHVRPVTGRTHQIRVHLAFAGLPIVGDPVYGRRGDRSGLQRQFLHAWRLTLRLPHAGERTFTAPLAPDLKRFLASLGEPRDAASPFAELA